MNSALILTGALALLAEPDFAITNVTVEVGDGTQVDDATVIVRDGRIAAVGADVKASGDLEIIDGTGKVLSPGLVESFSSLGLVEVGAESSTVDFRSTGTIVPAFRPSEAFNPSSMHIALARDEGITSAVTSPNGGIVSGGADWMDLTGELSSVLTLSDDPIALFVSAGQFGKGAAGGSRAAVWMELRELFDEARLYRSNPAAVDTGRITRRLRFSPLQLRAMVPVIERRIPVVIRADRASAILQTLAFAKTQNIRVILGSAKEAWKVADAIAEAKVPVMLNPQQLEPSTFSNLATRDDAATILRAAGVELLVSASGSMGSGGRLRQVAGVAVREGLSHGDAIRAITLAPALAYGKDADYGSVTVGKRADLVLWSGDPLELQTVAERVWIKGTVQSLETRHKELAQRYLKR